MFKGFRTILASTAVIIGMATTAGAATVTYTNSEANPHMQLTIDDAVTPGAFRFSLSTLVGAADFLGFGFNFAGVSLAQSAITLVSATRADNTAISPALQLLGDNTGSTNSCGGGCNFNGSESATFFDYIIRIGDNGGGQNNFVSTVVFDIVTAGSLDANPFSQLAIRAQSTTGPSTSIKTDLVQQTTPVPLPAGLPLLIGGIIALGALRRRRNVSA